MTAVDAERNFLGRTKRLQAKVFGGSLSVREKATGTLARENKQVKWLGRISQAHRIAILW